MSGSAAYETRDVSPKRVIYALVGLFGGVLASLALVGGLFALYGSLAHPPAATAVEATRLVPPAPRLETSLTGERAAVQEAAARLLDRYAWVDRAAGRARIPIDRAVALVADLGWSGQPQAETPVAPAATPTAPTAPIGAGTPALPSAAPTSP